MQAKHLLFPVLMMVLALAIPVVDAQTTTNTTTLVFSGRDTDQASKFLGDLWRGTSVQVVLEYEVDYELTGDDEIKDGEVKFVLPDGTEYRVWVGLGNDNVVLYVYENSQKVKEWELHRQDCGWTGCGGAHGTVTVGFSVGCDGRTTLTVMGERFTGSAIPPEETVSVYGDNHARITDTDNAGCVTPPPGADPADQQEDNTILYAAGIGAIGAIALGAILLRR